VTARVTGDFRRLPASNDVPVVVVSFIGGGNQSTERKPPTCHKSLTNFIT